MVVVQQTFNFGKLENFRNKNGDDFLPNGQNQKFSGVYFHHGLCVMKTW